MLSKPLQEEKQPRERSLHNCIDSHLKELQWTSYGLILVGASLVLRSVKAATKFRQVSDIPRHFISKNTRLQGHVRQVAETGDLLIEHVPILQPWQLPAKPKLVADQPQNCLCVRPAGVTLSPDAMRWLRETTHGRHVWFRLLEVTESVVECDITLWQGWRQGRCSVSEELVRQGVCVVRQYSSPPLSLVYNQLLSRLLALESRAEKRGRGLWREEKEQERSIPIKIAITWSRWIGQRFKAWFGRDKA